ncbi:hypothetical protein B0A48_03997 [Cryoendolithus antarcticus]|uniref:Uncharacterized protein n=1 Tax=Cryoendolithus antarcticus TaxID=1507870 RepID=A0A1V8TH31_9PEZI|nr:hypothetical protein B0A48_03997 [Cryoendolithus antarcticus]
MIRASKHDQSRSADEKSTQAMRTSCAIFIRLNAFKQRSSFQSLVNHAYPDSTKNHLLRLSDCPKYHASDPKNTQDFRLPKWTDGQHETAHQGAIQHTASSTTTAPEGQNIVERARDTHFCSPLLMNHNANHEMKRVHELYKIWYEYLDYGNFKAVYGSIHGENLDKTKQRGKGLRWGRDM